MSDHATDHPVTWSLETAEIAGVAAGQVHHEILPGVAAVLRADRIILCLHAHLMADDGTVTDQCQTTREAPTR